MDTVVAKTLAVLALVQTNLGHVSLCFTSILQTEEILKILSEFSQHENGKGEIIYRALH